MVDVKNFFRYNEHKFLTIRIWFMTAWYRFLLVALPRKNYQKSWGKLGEETPNGEDAITDEQFKFVCLVHEYVNRSGSRTPWKSLCLVRALTARKLFKEKHIPCTLYLGVGRDEEGKPVAHAWTRVGKYYVTGGDGSPYACVAKFANY